MRNKKVNWVLAAGAFVMLAMGGGVIARAGCGHMQDMRASSMGDMQLMEGQMTTQMDVMDDQMKEMVREI